MQEWKQQRQKSYFYNLRKFHNSIKRDLYNKYSNGRSVLELAFGRGGDLGKLYDNKASRVVGYDIAAESIKEAQRRLTDGSYPIDFATRVKLGVKDLASEIISGSQEFDVVSSMFAFHYFFKNEQTFKTIMASIENNLKIGGVLLLCLFDGDSVRKRLNKPFSDSHFHIRSRNVDVNDASLFGHKVNVLLRDDIQDVSSDIYNPEDEYLVDFQRFVRVMQMIGFELVESELFETYYTSKAQKSFRLSATEKDVSFLNRTMVFRRTVDIEERLSCLHNNVLDQQNTKK